jgi:hypothetical protein
MINQHLECWQQNVDALVFNARNSDLLSLDTIKLCEVGKVFRTDGEKIMLALGVRQIKKIKGITSESILAEDVENLKKSIGSDFKFELTKGEFGVIAEIDFDSLLKFTRSGDLSDLISNHYLKTKISKVFPIPIYG